MYATAKNYKGKTEKNKKVKSGECIFPFKFKRELHQQCVDTDKGAICATEINPKTRTLTKYGYCPYRKMKTITARSLKSKKKTLKKMKPRRRLVVVSDKRKNEEYVKILEELQDINARRGEPFRARAYQKAAESIMLHQGDITKPEQVAGLPGIGATILDKLKEYDETGTLRAIEKQKTDPMNVLTKVYGIGPKKAKKLIQMGATTVADLRKMKSELDRVQLIGLEHHEAIQERIPRKEIDKFNQVFQKAFDSIKTPGAEFQIVGSYRRGAKDSGDIDVIVSDKDTDSPLILTEFIDVLKREGVITHVLSQGRTKCLAIGKLSESSTPRRLDFLYAPPSEYAAAVLYFTGSKTFNTRQRQRALDMGYTLSEHGLHHLVSGKKGPRVDQDFPDEKSIFKFLKMDYLTPQERNNPVIKPIKQKKAVTPKPASVKRSLRVVPGSTKERLERFVSEGKSGLKGLTQKQLADMVAEADQAYYGSGKPILSDDQYDLLRSLTKVESKGHASIKMSAVQNKVKLPYEMWSMDKIKPDTEALGKWEKKYKGPYVLSCKLDGVSGMYSTETETPALYTRGNGKVGQDISRFIPFMKLPDNKGLVIRGEFIIAKELFAAKYASKFANPRNFVAGVMNSKNPDKDKLADISFVAYEVIQPELTPSAQLAMLEQDVDIEVVQYLVRKDVTNDLLSELLADWRLSYKYEIDGVICTNDKIYKRTSKNPAHSFAFKMVLGDQIAESQVVEVIWTPSKDGYLKPRVQIVPVVLGGAKIEYATGFNAKFIEDNKIGVGAVISIIRSGDVIPHITGVVRPAPEPQMPTVPYEWNSTHVDILLVDKDNDAIVQEKQIVGFFKNIGVDGLRTGYVKRLIEAGFNTVPKILAMTRDEFLEIRGVKAKLADKLYDGIREGMNRASLPELLHASNIFGRGFGKKRFRALLTEVPDILTAKESADAKVERVMNVEGMGQKSAKLFVDRIPEFLKWAGQAGVTDLTFKAKKKPKTKLTGMKIVMTGFRDPEMVDQIEEMGGEVVGSVSSSVDLVIVSEIDSDSGKAEKARSLEIPLITKEDFEKQFLT